MKNIEMEACLIIEEIYKEYYSVIFPVYYMPYKM